MLSLILTWERERGVCEGISVLGVGRNKVLQKTENSDDNRVYCRISRSVEMKLNIKN